MSAGVVVLFAVLGAVAGAVVLVPALRTIPEPWEPESRVQVAIVVANAVLWALAANKFSRGWVLLPYLVVFSVFPGLAVTVVLMVIASFVVLPTASDAFTVLGYAGVGLLAYFGILFVAHIVYPRGMGFGDVKLAMLMGLGLGWVADSYASAIYLILVALIVGCVLGIVFGLLWRVVQRQGGAFPFGPALAVSAIYVILTFDRYLV
jgi:leader peptidase (prepilin peptidase) / N-methyltransferase